MKTTTKIEPQYASGNRKSWWKAIANIDSTQKGGYAFNGEFLSAGEAELPAGSLLLQVVPGGSVKNPCQEGQLYRLNDDGSKTLLVAGDWRQQSVTLRKAAEEYLAAQTAVVVEAANKHVAAQLAAATVEELLAELRKRNICYSIIDS